MLKWGTDLTTRLRMPDKGRLVLPRVILAPLVTHSLKQFGELTTGEKWCYSLLAVDYRTNNSAVKSDVFPQIK